MLRDSSGHRAYSGAWVIVLSWAGGAQKDLEDGVGGNDINTVLIVHL